MGFSTETQGGFIASPGWSRLFADSDRILDEHEAVAGHRTRVSIKSKGGIDYQPCCCDALFDALLPLERASHRMCQACGEPGEMRSFRVECERHRGEWPYGARDP